jgi:hypothetical protein
LLFQFDAGQHGDKIDGIVVASKGIVAKKMNVLPSDGRNLLE